MSSGSSSEVPAVAQQAVLVQSGELPVQPVHVKGYDFNSGIDYHELLKSFKTTGFQAMNFGLAVEEINKMVDCVVTTAGGVEEDFIKCMAPTYLGDFSLNGSMLRDKGINRIGNLLAPNDNYCKFEDWLMPILDQLLKEQKEEGALWTPSKVIARLGKEINNPESVYYWCYKNNIPVFSPALTDGSLGDMIYFHSYKNPGLVIDIVEDIRRMNSQAVYAINTGMILLGGGLMKHHICNANLMRNGADYSVFVNTASEFDGSDSGAKPDEAISWGKIKKTATPAKVYADASLVFPLLVAETFARRKKELVQNKAQD